MSTMTCDCGGELRVENTYPAGRHGQTRDYRCAKCRKRLTSVTFLTRDRKITGCGKTLAKYLQLGLIRPDDLLAAKPSVETNGHEKSQPG
jgi:hypothetical protein